MQLQGYPELVANIFLAEICTDVVHLPIEVECQDISHAGIDGQVGQGKVGGCLQIEGKGQGRGTI